MPFAKDARGVLDHTRTEKKSFLRIRIFDINRYSSDLAKKYNFQVIDLHYLVRDKAQHRCKDGMHYDALIHRQISTHLAQYLSAAFHPSLTKAENGNEDIRQICHDVICLMVKKCDEQLSRYDQERVEQFHRSAFRHPAPSENFNEKEMCLLYLIDQDEKHSRY